MRTNQQNDIMKQGQLPRKETRKMCCLDNQSEYFQLSRTKTGGNGRKEDGENRYIQVIKKNESVCCWWFEKVGCEYF